jgi:hypothetical protein
VIPSARAPARATILLSAAVSMAPKATFAKYGVYYAAGMKNFFVSTLY